MSRQRDEDELRGRRLAREAEERRQRRLRQDHLARDLFELAAVVQDPGEVSAQLWELEGSGALSPQTRAELEVQLQRHFSFDFVNAAMGHTTLEPAPGRRFEPLEIAPLSLGVERMPLPDLPTGAAARTSVAPGVYSHSAVAGLQLKRRDDEEATAEPAEVEATIERARRNARSGLPHRQRLEAALGEDLSGVQVATGPAAREAAAALGAEAFADDELVVLGGGEELETVAHEAAHVVQRRRGQRPTSQAERSRLEQEADAVAASIARSEDRRLEPLTFSTDLRQLAAEWRECARGFAEDGAAGERRASATANGDAKPSADAVATEAEAHPQKTLEAARGVGRDRMGDTRSLVAYARGTLMVLARAVRRGQLDPSDADAALFELAQELHSTLDEADGGALEQLVELFRQASFAHGPRTHRDQDGDGVSLVERALRGLEPPAGPSGRDPTDAAVRAVADEVAGVGFSSPRVSASSEGRQRSEALGARAAMEDGRVLWGPAAPEPGTPEGRELVAHEVIHVQQAQLPGEPNPAAAEAEARELAAEVRGGGRLEAPVVPLASTAVAREDPDEKDGEKKTTRQKELKALRKPLAARVVWSRTQVTLKFRRGQRFATGVDKKLQLLAPFVAHLVGDGYEPALVQLVAPHMNIGSFPAGPATRKDRVPAEFSVAPSFVTRAVSELEAAGKAVSAKKGQLAKMEAALPREHLWLVFTALGMTNGSAYQEGYDPAVVDAVVRRGRTDQDIGQSVEGTSGPTWPPWYGYKWMSHQLRWEPTLQARALEAIGRYKAARGTEGLTALETELRAVQHELAGAAWALDAACKEPATAGHPIVQEAFGRKPEDSGAFEPGAFKPWVVGPLLRYLREHGRGGDLNGEALQALLDRYAVERGSRKEARETRKEEARHQPSKRAVKLKTARGTLTMRFPKRLKAQDRAFAKEFAKRLLAAAGEAAPPSSVYVTFPLIEAWRKLDRLAPEVQERIFERLAAMGAEQKADWTPASFEQLVVEDRIAEVREAVGAPDEEQRGTAHEPVSDRPVQGEIRSASGMIVPGKEVEFDFVMTDKSVSRMFDRGRMRIDWIVTAEDEWTGATDKPFAREHIDRTELEREPFEVTFPAPMPRPDGEAVGRWRVTAIVRHNHYHDNVFETWVEVRNTDSWMDQREANAFEGLAGPGGTGEVHDAKFHLLGSTLVGAESDALGAGLTRMSDETVFGDPETRSGEIAVGSAATGSKRTPIGRRVARYRALADAAKATWERLRSAPYPNADAVEAAKREVERLSNLALEVEYAGTQKNTSTFDVRGTYIGVDNELVGDLDLIGTYEKGEDGHVATIHDNSTLFGAGEKTPMFIGEGSTPRAAVMVAIERMVSHYPKGGFVGILAEVPKAGRGRGTETVYERRECHGDAVHDHTREWMLLLGTLASLIPGIGAAVMVGMMAYNAKATLDELDKKDNAGLLTTSDTLRGVGEILFDVIPAVAQMRRVGGLGMVVLDKAGEAWLFREDVKAAAAEMRNGLIRELVELDGEIAQAEAKNPSSKAASKLRDRRLALLKDISTAGERTFVSSALQAGAMRLPGHLAAKARANGWAKDDPILQKAREALFGESGGGAGAKKAAGGGDAKPRGKHAPELARELQGAGIGDVPVMRTDELAGATVLVRYDPSTRKVHVEAGPKATPTDIKLHVETVKTLRKYQGTFGKVRAFGSRVRQLLTGHPAYGTEGFEARLEVRKLKGILAYIEESEAYLQSRALAYSADPELAGKRAEAAALQARVDDIRAQLEHHRRRVESFEKGNLWVAAIDNAELERRKQQWKSSANYAELESKGIFGMDLAQARPLLSSLGYEDAKGGRFIHADGDDAKHVRLQINQGKIVPEDKNPPKRGLRKKPLPSGKNALKVTPEVQKRLDGLPKGLKVKLEEIRLEGAASAADFNRAVDLTEKLASSPFDNHSVLKTLGAFHRQHGDDQTGPLAELQHAVDLVKEGRIGDGTVASLSAENKKGRPIDLGEKSQNKSVDLGGISEADVVFEAPDGTVHVHEVKATVSALVDKHGEEIRKRDFRETQQGRGKQWESAGPGKRKYEVHVKATNDCGALFSENGLKVLASLAQGDVELWLGTERFAGPRLIKLVDKVKRASGPPPGVSTAKELASWLKSQT